MQAESKTQKVLQKMTALAYSNDRYIARRHLLKHLRTTLLIFAENPTARSTFSFW